MKHVLIDSDVLPDVFMNRKPFAESAVKVLSLCETGEITGWTTSVILSNTYYLLRTIATHQKVIDRLKQLLSFTEVLITNK